MRIRPSNRFLALTGSLQNGVPLEILGSVGLQGHGNAAQRILDGFARAGVDHARLEFVSGRKIGKPATLALIPVLSSFIYVMKVIFDLFWVSLAL